MGIIPQIGTRKMDDLLQGIRSATLRCSEAFVNPNGETVARMVLDVDGHDVRLQCIEGDTSKVLVIVDGVWADKQMPLAKADGYIRSKI